MKKQCQVYSIICSLLLASSITLYGMEEDEEQKRNEALALVLQKKNPSTTPSFLDSDSDDTQDAAEPLPQFLIDPSFFLNQLPFDIIVDGETDLGSFYLSQAFNHGLANQMPALLDSDGENLQDVEQENGEKEEKESKSSKKRIPLNIYAEIHNIHESLNTTRASIQKLQNQLPELYKKNKKVFFHKGVDYFNAFGVNFNQSLIKLINKYFTEQLTRNVSKLIKNAEIKLLYNIDYESLKRNVSILHILEMYSVLQEAQQILDNRESAIIQRYQNLSTKYSNLANGAR